MGIKINTSAYVQPQKQMNFPAVEDVRYVTSKFASVERASFTNEVLPDILQIFSWRL
ncbi:MAG: hypothetical protein LBG15_14680 [Dysgonamonadaceae bacterium]|jgi:hypothetical protein|nr:hypothetical protein [Dysgonamonadaceae bacterium]